MTKWSIAALLLAATSAAAAAVDCSVPQDPKHLEERNYSCLQDPGWFDIGGGVAILRHAGSQGQHGIGNMVTVRAYPFGRWYAPLKTATPASTSKVAASVVIANNAQMDATNKQAAADQAKKSNAPDAGDKQAAADQAKADADKAAKDVVLSMQSALSDFGSMYSVGVPGENRAWRWLQHVSVFYGRSVGGFDSNVVKGDINAFGVTFDIAPQFSVAYGRAYYYQLPQNGASNSISASKPVYGIQLNLNAFKAIRNITGSL
jgi:hypothetical protein